MKRSGSMSSSPLGSQPATWTEVIRAPEGASVRSRLRNAAQREGSPSTAKAEGEGLQVMGLAEVSAWADVLMLTMPDELQADTYRKYVHDNLREGSAIAFAHTGSVCCLQVPQAAATLVDHHPATQNSVFRKIPERPELCADFFLP